MNIKYTKSFLSKLEDIFSESEYILRYEKGNFKSGYCLIHHSKVAVINKFYSLEGKINCLIDILKEIQLDDSGMEEKNQKLLQKILQHEEQAPLEKEQESSS